jgi:hypothetical protein
VSCQVTRLVDSTATVSYLFVWIRSPSRRLVRVANLSARISGRTCKVPVRLSVRIATVLARYMYAYLHGLLRYLER